MATRLIMVKRDGCVAIHADGGAYKPLNWMVAPNRLVEGDGQWTVTKAVMSRSARVLMEGAVRVPQD